MWRIALLFYLSARRWILGSSPRMTVVLRDSCIDVIKRIVIPAPAGIQRLSVILFAVLFFPLISHAQVLPPTLIVSNVLYNASGQMTQVTYGNGNITTYAYNNMQRLTQLKTIDDSSTTIQELNYTYDGIGNILSIVDNVNTADQTFEYDHLNRLTQAVGQTYGTH